MRSRSASMPPSSSSSSCGPRASTRRSGGSGRTCSTPISTPTRRSAGCAILRAPGCRSARRCSTSARWPGSATSGRTRRCGPNASRRSPRSAPSTTRPWRGWSRPRAGSCSPVPAPRLVRPGRGLAQRLRPRRPAVPALPDADRQRTAGHRHPADDLLVPDLPGDAGRDWRRCPRPSQIAAVSSRSMCEHFIARASEPFRLDELWPFTEKLERYGIAGFGWGAAWLDAAGGLGVYRDLRAFRDDPGARDGRRHRDDLRAGPPPPAVAAVDADAARHPAVRRPGRPLRVQPQRRPARLQGPARDVPSRGPHPRPRRHRGRGTLARGRVAAGRVPGRPAGGAPRPVRRAGQPRDPGRRRDAAPLRGQRREPGLRLPPGRHRDRVDRDLLARPLAVPVRRPRRHGPHGWSACAPLSHSAEMGVTPS